MFKNNFVKCKVGTQGLAKIWTTGSFSKTPPQTSPNFLKIVEKISFHQNNYFRSIKTCFKIFWSNAKRGHRVPWAQQRGDNRQGILGLAKIGTTGSFSKTLEGVIEGKFSYHCCIILLC
jgi:hypothetical protein